MNRVWKPTSLYVMAVLVFGLGFVVACGGGSDTKQPAGGTCSQKSDCEDGLDCRAKRCRTPLVNKTPTANVKVDPVKGAKVGDKVAVSGADSRDGDEDLLTYKWSLKGPDGSKAEINDERAKDTFFTPDLPGTYTVGLIVNDGKEDSELYSIDVNVADRDNTDPVANAGQDQDVLPTSKVALDGTGSTDPDGDKLTYNWTLKTKPEGSNATLDKPDAEKPTFTADAPGDYIITLVVTDTLGAKSQEDNVTVRAIEGLDKVPSLTSVTPTEGISQSQVDVVIVGKDFVDGATILLGSQSFKTAFENATKLNAKLDLTRATPGENDLKVINPNGKESNALKFNVKPIPTPELTQIEPALAPTGSRVALKVTGTGFIKGSEVFFDSTPLPTTFVSETEIAAQIDLKGIAESTFKVSVRNPGGINSKNQLDFRVLPPLSPPVLRVLNPPQGTTGTKMAFSVHGTGFEIGAQIIFDGKAIPTKRIRRDELQADPELDLSAITPGTYDVWVRNIDGQESAKEKFIVDGTNPTPTLDRVLPFSIYIDEKTDLSVFGRSFAKDAKFFINGVEIPINRARSSSTFMEAKFDGTQAGVWKPGNYKAWVTNPNPGGTDLKSNDFTVTVTYPTPSVDAITPSGWNIGCNANISITGKNFTKSSIVKFGSIQYEQGATAKNKLTYVSDKELTFTVKKSDLSLTTYKVIVDNGPNAAAPAVDFPVLNSSNTPAISYIRPGAGPADSIIAVNIGYDSTAGRFLPGAYLEYNGKVMPTSCQISFDNSYCYSLDAQLDLTGAKPGTVQMYVYNPCGKKSGAQTYIVTDAPQPFIYKVSPTYAVEGSSSLLTITGDNIAKNHTLFIDGKQVPSVWKSATEIITSAAYDFKTIKAGTNLDVYVAHANGKKSSTIKFSVMAQSPGLTITGLGNDTYDVGKSHSNVEINGSGFTTTSKLYIDGKETSVGFNGPGKLTIATLNLTSDPGGVKLLQVKNGTTESNYFWLFAKPIPPAVLDYTSPSSRIKGSTSTYLYVYGQRICGGLTSGTSTRCASNPTIQIIGPDKKDYSSRYTVSYGYETYIYGNFNDNNLPAGAYLFYLVRGTTKSNPVVYQLNNPPPPEITGQNILYRGDTRSVQLTGTNFAPGDTAIFNNNQLNPIPLTLSGTTSASFTLDLSQVKYGGKFPVYIRRCDDPSCTTSNNSKVFQLEVKEIPSCTIAGNCATALKPAGSEGCTSYNSVQTCRPTCTTTAQCKAMLGAPSTATCSGGYCK